jgi:glucose-1-phosphate thymidylyltransferase
MICLILAAGYATRLYPLTKNFPKPLLSVQGKSVLDWLVDDVETIPGIERYVIVTNHTFFHFFSSWKEKKHLSHPVDVLDDGSTCNENRVGAVKDILFAIGQLSLSSDLLILAGDNVLEFSLGSFVAYFRKKNASCILRHYQGDVARLRRTGVAVVDAADLVLSMEEKPVSPKSNWAVPPFYCFKGSDLQSLPLAIASGCGTDAPGSFISWACSHFPIYAMLMPGKRYDIGNLESYEVVQKEYRGIIS